jgi:hydroxypyruvate isomerase
MFDCYHLQIMQGDLYIRAKEFMDQIGHIQFASVPARAEPDKCELNYPILLPRFYEAGYQGYIGAEYKPTSTTDDGLGWMAAYRL